MADVINDVLPSTNLDSLYLHQFSVPGPNGKVYDAAIRLSDALADEALLVYELDGRPLTPELGIECSMSPTGDCYDNAVAERFFWSLKHEWTKHESFADLEAARLSVFK